MTRNHLPSVEQRDTTNTTTKTEGEKRGRRAHIYEADLSSSDSLSSLLPEILGDGHRIDILLNCAGVQRRHASHQFPIDDWNEGRRTSSYTICTCDIYTQVLAVNLTAVFTLCRDVGAHMLEQLPNSSGKKGSIINVASLLSFQGGLNVPA